MYLQVRRYSKAGSPSPDSLVQHTGVCHVRSLTMDCIRGVTRLTCRFKIYAHHNAELSTMEMQMLERS